MHRKTYPRLRQVVWAAAVGICIFLLDYALILPYYMDRYQILGLHVFRKSYFRACALVPVLLVPPVLCLLGKFTQRDCGWLLLSALVQLLMLPLLYWYLVRVDHVTPNLFTFCYLFLCVLFRTATVTLAEMLGLYFLCKLTQ